MRALPRILAFGVLTGFLGTPAGAATYYVDVNNSQCSDTVGAGTQTRPFCSIRYSATIANPGDIFLISNGRYGHGGNFTRSGTASAPITWRATGSNVSMGTFDDVRDEDFVTTQYTNVYSIPWTRACCDEYRVTQTYFAPIVVDDPNASNFTMRQEDGVLALHRVGDFTTLTNVEGTWLYSGGRIYVHTYGNRVPSTSGTDLVVGHIVNGRFQVRPDTQYNIFDGLILNYAGGTSTPPFIVYGSNNRFLNLRFQSTTWALRGNNNYAENISVSHVIERGETWEWHYSGNGTALSIQGNNHVLKNIRVFHSWNAQIQTEGSNGVTVDGLRAYGSPNHCGLYHGARNLILRNWIAYNCQDYLWINESDNFVIEHATLTGGIYVMAEEAPMGGVTIRNSIMGGSWNFDPVRSRSITCEWERESVFENNIISANATIKHCTDNREYPIRDYITRCQNGQLSPCLTIRNNVFVSDFRTVIRDGLWNESLGDTWDAHIVTNSPAIDAGTLSATRFDIAQVARPQGRSPDAGIYEYCGGTCNPTPIQIPIPTLALNLPPILPMDAQISATYSGGSPAIRFDWVFIPAQTIRMAPSVVGAPGAAGASSARFSTARPQADLSQASLTPGLYWIAVSVVDSSNYTFGPAQARVTFLAGNLASSRAYPNPWRSDRHRGMPITFDQLTDDTTVKIFTLSGRWVKTLDPGITSTTWDLTTHKGDKVASGMYIYLLSSGSGEKKTGQLHIIK
jgi:hypothetical protein